VKARSLKQDLKERDRQIAALTGELTEVKVQPQPTISPEDIMPITAWRYPEFDPTLAEKIENVALNSLLQPASKLNQIYKLIVKFYTDALTKSDAQSRAFVEETERVKAIVNQFAVDISLLLSLGSNNYDDFVNRGGAQKIVQQVTGQRFEPSRTRLFCICRSFPGIVWNNSGPFRESDRAERTIGSITTWVKSLEKEERRTAQSA
jgi:hypothetical protein